MPRIETRDGRSVRGEAAMHKIYPTLAELGWGIRRFARISLPVGLLIWVPRSSFARAGYALRTLRDRHLLSTARRRLRFDLNCARGSGRIMAVAATLPIFRFGYQSAHDWIAV